MKKPVLPDRIDLQIGGARDAESRRGIDGVLSINVQPRRKRSRRKVKRVELNRRLRKPLAFISPDLLNNSLRARERNETFTSSDVKGTSLKQKASSWFSSCVLHAALIVFLALLLFPSAPKKTEIEAVFSSELGDQLETITDDEGNLNPTEAESYEITIPEDDFKIEDVVVFQEKEKPFDHNANSPFDQATIDASELLSGRTDPGLKNDLLSKYGGTRLTEEAVEAGLEWLSKQQLKDGSWSLMGPYDDGVNGLVDNKPAATALALLAFQGAGNTRSSGKRSSSVRKGWVWLLKQQNDDGCFAPEKRVHESLFYTQAVCSLALCELLTLEKKPNSALRKQAELAIGYLLENQHAELGGWKYAPQVGSDLSVTGWCLMALRTAQMAGFNVPKEHFDRISSFLDSVSYDDGSRYAYQADVNGQISASDRRYSMTATGLLCREYLGWKPDDPVLLRGAASLVSPNNLVRFPKSPKEGKEREEAEETAFFHNVYGWYSTSMALKGLGPYNRYWRTWNAALSKELPLHQEPKGSKEAGSWNPRYDEYAFGGGRLYVTALSILCLEVYYRHLSLYR